MNFDLTAYEDATTFLHEDLAGVKGIATPIGELLHVESALSSLEVKLANLKLFAKRRPKVGSY